MAAISRHKTVMVPRPSAGGRAAAEARHATRRRLFALATAFTLGALLTGALMLAVTRPSSTERSVERLQAEAALRDKEQIKALTELARTTRDRVTFVLDGLEKAMPTEPPAGGGTGPVAAPPTDVAQWRQAAAAAVKGFADPPSGETATNVARSSLASAVRQIATTVDTYASSQALTGPNRETMTALAIRQRADAIFTWSIGATALDAVNVDAGYGHQHVFLPASPGSGALTTDPEHEGSN
ncbi:hypothetical protein ACFU8W_32660 [Streptomyces sp. NPDC057565]|uniref:hypothetical protein n=1 Tax=Streptomyces sp. NPDC057565 TaxID=3346169 RepID=UPI00369C47C3